MANYAEKLDQNAAMRKGHGRKSKFSHYEVKPAENGGAIVQHFHESPDGYGTQKHGNPHAFSEDEHKEFAGHFKEHFKMPKPSDGDGTHGGTDVEPEEE